MDDEWKKQSEKNRVWGVKCLVQSCGITKRIAPDARFFRLPRHDIKLRDKWVRACGLKDPPAAKKTYVCNRHFENYGHRLSRYAYPTVNICPYNEKKENKEIDTKTSDKNVYINSQTDDKNKNLVKITVMHNNVPAFNLCVFKKKNGKDDKSDDQQQSIENVDQDEKSQVSDMSSEDVKIEDQDDCDQQHDDEQQNENQQNDDDKISILSEENVKINNYDEALKYLKPLEDLLFFHEDLRAIGLLNQLEICFKERIELKNQLKYSSIK